MGFRIYGSGVQIINFDIITKTLEAEVLDQIIPEIKIPNWIGWKCLG